MIDAAEARERVAAGDISPQIAWAAIRDRVTDREKRRLMNGETLRLHAPSPRPRLRIGQPLPEVLTLEPTNQHVILMALRPMGFDDRGRLWGLFGRWETSTIEPILLEGPWHRGEGPIT